MDYELTYGLRKDKFQTSENLKLEKDGINKSMKDKIRELLVKYHFIQQNLPKRHPEP